MSTSQIFPITTQPGIKKDGTEYAGNYYIDGQWVRFQRGLTQKMGGYQEMIRALPNIPRGLYVNPDVNQGEYTIFIGDQSTLRQYFFDDAGSLIGGPVDRTPLLFRADVNNVWQFDVLYSASAGESYIFAHAAPNLADINSQIETPIYYGILSTAGLAIPLTPLNKSVSGGIVALHPYLLAFGNNGLVSITDPANPTIFTQTFPVCSQKIVVGKQIRAGVNSPGGLLWSLDSLIKTSFTIINNVPTFRFDTITDESSILSSSSIIEYDGLMFWAGIDRFLLYNGAVQEIPNQMNLNFFYQNLNYPQRQKVWATKYPAKGEIHFFFPYGNSNESNKFVTFNIRENTWYNNSIDRGCGYFEQVYADPVWASNTPDINGQYSIFTHEKGVDSESFDGTLTPIPSYIETGDIAFCAEGPTGSWVGTERWINLERLELDAIQTGDMTLTVKGRIYARSQLVTSDPYTFTPTTEKIDLREQRRHMTLRFESNVLGGYYEFGQMLLHIKPGDTRP